MTNDMLLRLLVRLKQENEVPYTSVASGVRKDFESWGIRKGCIVLEKIGNGKKFKVTSHKTLEFEINRLQPCVDLQNLSPRLQNLAVNKDTKIGDTSLDYTYCICRAVGEDVVVNGCNVSAITKALGCFSLPIAGNMDGAKCNSALILVENQLMIDDLKWLPTEFQGVVLYYAGNLSERTLKWLKKGSFTSVSLFSDYDAVGINNFANLKTALPAAQWFWMQDWKNVLEKHGNKDLWTKEYQHTLFENLWSKFMGNGFPDPQLKILMEEIRKQGKMLEQESALL